MGDNVNADTSAISVTSKLDLAKMLEGVSTQAPAQTGIPGGIDVAAAIQGMSAAAPGLKAKFAAAAEAGISKALQTAETQAAATAAAAAQATQQKAIQDAIITNMTNKRAHEINIESSAVARAYATPEKLIALSKQVELHDKQLDAQLADISARRHNGFFDNPIQWIYDQFALPADTEAYNVDVTMRNALAKQRDAAVAEGTNAANFIKNTAVLKSAEIVEAEAQSTALKALSDVQVSKTVQARYSIPFAQDMLKVVQGSFGQQMQQINYNLAASAQSFQQAHIRNFVEPNMTLEKQIKEKLIEDRTAMEALIATVNAKVFPPAKSGDGIRRYTVSDVNNMSLASREALLQVGLAAHGTNVYSPSQLRESWNTLGAPLNPTANEVKSAMNASYQEIQLRIAADKNLDTALQDPVARKAKVDLEFNRTWANFNKDPAVDSAPALGMLTIGQMHTYTNGGLADNQVWKAIVGDPTKPPEAVMQSRLSTAQIDNAAAALVAQGADTKVIATQAAMLFQTVTAHNTHIGDLASFGLPAQHTWIYRTPEFANKTFAGESKPWDHTDVVKYQNWLERQKAAGLASRLGETINKAFTSATTVKGPAVDWISNNIFNQPASKK